MMNDQDAPRRSFGPFHCGTRRTFLAHAPGWGWWARVTYLVYGIGVGRVFFGFLVDRGSAFVKYTPSGDIDRWEGLRRDD